MKNFICLIVALILTLAASAQPTTITYQGKLIDSQGNAINQSGVMMTFAMYDAASGGNLLWPDSGYVTKNVDATFGLYSVQLGTGIGTDTVFTAAMFNGKTPWLEVTVMGNTLTRSPVSNVPFSLISNELGSAGWASPGALGSITPNSGAFTTLNVSGNTHLGDTLVLHGPTNTLTLTCNPGSARSIQFPDTSGTVMLAEQIANYVDSGTQLNSTLYWNGTKWTENTALLSDTSGNTFVHGQLSVFGPLEINKNDTAANYIFPLTKGKDGQILTTNGDGTTEWTSMDSVGYLKNGGNKLGAKISMGTKDNFGLSLVTNKEDRLTVSNSGSVSIPAFDTKGVIHNNSSGTLSSSKVTGEDIEEQTITNSNIAEDAHISDTKISEINTPLKVANSATTATPEPVPEAIVRRNALGGFSAVEITAKLIGTASNALEAEVAATAGFAATAGIAANATSAEFAISAGTASSASNATTSSHLAGGAQGSIPYQSGANDTKMLSKGSAGQVLTMNAGATAPTWTNPAMLTNFTESNYITGFKTGVRLQATHAATDVDVVLQPKGAGAFLAQQPDNGATGGLHRGSHAVDLQTTRLDSTRVASGNASVITGGMSNRSAGDFAVISGGQSNTASGLNTFVGGGYNNTASGKFSSVPGGQNNDAQSYGETVIGLFADTVDVKNSDSAILTDRLLVVGNGTADSSRSSALIILKNANTTIGGSLTINGNDSVSSYTFPVTRGTGGQLLTTDGNGLTSWANVINTNIAGGAQGSIPYQSSADTTAMLAKGTAYQILTMNDSATAPVWMNPEWLTNFTESNYTSGSKTGVKLAAASSSPDADLVIQPKGAGAILAQQPDTTATGGLNRGSNAVDLQTTRADSTMVASGHAAVIAGGMSNTSSGDFAVVTGGQSNTASGLNSFAGGGYGNTASGKFSSVPGGKDNYAQSYGETVIGLYADTVDIKNSDSAVLSDRLFVVGNGTAADARSSALTILKNANTSIGGSLKINRNDSLSSYTFPLSRGTSGQLLVTDGHGATAWSGMVLTNISGGAQGSIPYQSATDTTAMLAKGTAGQVLTMNGSATAPVWANVSPMTSFTESTYTYGTKTGVKLQATNALTNVDLVLQPKGAGAFMAQKPDGTEFGGYNRGENAVDLQTSRASAAQVASGIYSVITGGVNNFAPALCASVSGGENNAATANYAIIAGGQSNNATGNSSAITGGGFNLASGTESFIGGGSHNHATETNSVVAGGRENGAYGQLSFIGGGYANLSTAGYAAVAGGNFNKASGLYSFVGSGDENVASGSNSSVVGGSGNYAQAFGETVTGLYLDTVDTKHNYWVATDRLFSVGNGTDENSRSSALTILKNANTSIGGSLKINSNSLLSSYTFPTARGTSGQLLITDGSGATAWSDLVLTNISGGAQGSIPYQSATDTTAMLAKGIAGQVLTMNSSATAPVWANVNTLTSFTESTYTYGTKTGVKLQATNAVTDVDLVLEPKGAGAFMLQKPDGTEFGGINRGEHAVDLQTSRASATQVASGTYSVISGGENNTATALYASVAGGTGNVAGEEGAAVGGGGSNAATDQYAVVAGGYENIASSVAALVGGGISNVADGQASTISGGLSNYAGG